jgi:hypothetical protein
MAIRHFLDIFVEVVHRLLTNKVYQVLQRCGSQKMYRVRVVVRYPYVHLPAVKQSLATPLRFEWIVHRSPQPVATVHLRYCGHGHIQEVGNAIGRISTFCE